MLAIATGAVRDAPDRDEFLAFLKETVGIGVRVISGREEASLLAQGFLRTRGPTPALLIDIGGGGSVISYFPHQLQGHSLSFPVHRVGSVLSFVHLSWDAQQAQDLSLNG